MASEWTYVIRKTRSGKEFHGCGVTHLKNYRLVTSFSEDNLKCDDAAIVEENFHDFDDFEGHISAIPPKACNNVSSHEGTDKTFVIEDNTIHKELLVPAMPAASNPEGAFLVNSNMSAPNRFQLLDVDPMSDDDGSDAHKRTRRGKRKGKAESNTSNARKRRRRNKNPDVPVRSELLGRMLENARVTESLLDPSAVQRTQPGFISKGRGRAEDFHAVECDGTYQMNPSGLDPECDKDVRDLVENAGWGYLENRPNQAELVTDLDGNIPIIKVRQPGGEWDAICQRVDNAIQELHKRIGSKAIPAKKDHSKRVQQTPHKCPCLSVGLSMGNGQQAPGYLKHSDKVEDAIHKFVENPDVVKFVGHVTSSFRMYYPAHTKMYSDNQLALEIYDMLVTPYFPHSPFSAMSINLGPEACARWHRDEKNILWGICAIAVFGLFNHRRGGHLLLHELKLIMELCPGDLVFLPSAAITHRNSPIRKSESRRSIVMYRAGALFRWIWQRHQTEDKASCSSEKVVLGERRWKHGWGLFPTVADLWESIKCGVSCSGSASELTEVLRHPDLYPAETPFAVALPMQ